MKFGKNILPGSPLMGSDVLLDRNRIIKRISDAVSEHSSRSYAAGVASTAGVASAAGGEFKEFVGP